MVSSLMHGRERNNYIKLKKITIMIQTKTLKEALKDPGVIEVVEGLLPRVSPDSDGLLTMNDYSRTVPVHRYGSTLPKIVLKFPDGTIDRYAHLLVLVHDSLFKLDYYSDSRACLSTRLFGNHSVLNSAT